MAAIRTFFKRTVSQHTSNSNNLSDSTDSSSETLSTTTTEHLNNQTNDGYNSTSTLGALTVNSDDSLRRPLLHVHTTNRRKKRFSCLSDNHTTTMSTEQEQITDDNTCLLDKALPKELVLR
jgi:hypothetical protein